jgi:hypothetical protein
VLTERSSVSSQCSVYARSDSREGADNDQTWGRTGGNDEAERGMVTGKMTRSQRRPSGRDRRRRTRPQTRVPDAERVRTSSAVPRWMCTAWTAAMSANSILLDAKRDPMEYPQPSGPKPRRTEADVRAFASPSPAENASRRVPSVPDAWTELLTARATDCSGRSRWVKFVEPLTGP